MFDRLRRLLGGDVPPPKTSSLDATAPPDRKRQGPFNVGEDRPTSQADARAYLNRVQTKINQLAEEFAGGNINRTQFQELFEHYRKEVQAIETLIEVDPESEAWKEAMTEGESLFIRRRHVAKALGYAIYENESGMPLKTIGRFEVDADLAIPMLSSYRSATKEIFGAGMRSTEIESGRWLCYVPGEITTLMALFSTEPAGRQLDSLEDLHQLFEQANRNLLNQPPVDPDQLVFPHVFYLGQFR